MLACADFAFPNELSLSQPASFLIFTLQILSTIPPGGREGVNGLGAKLLVGVKPQQVPLIISQLSLALLYCLALIFPVQVLLKALFYLA